MPILRSLPPGQASCPTYQQRGGREKCQPLPFIFFRWALQLHSPYSQGLFPKTLVLSRRHDIVTEKRVFSWNKWQLLSFRPRNSLLLAAQTREAERRGRWKEDRRGELETTSTMKSSAVWGHSSALEQTCSAVRCPPGPRTHRASVQAPL